MTTYSVLDALEDGATEQYLGEVRIVNAAADRFGNFYVPGIGCIDGPEGITLIGIRHRELAFGLPPQLAVGFGLSLARYTLTKTTSANRALRDDLIEQCYALIEELGATPVHESAVLQ